MLACKRKPAEERRPGECAPQRPRRRTAQAAGLDVPGGHACMGLLRDAAKAPRTCGVRHSADAEATVYESCAKTRRRLDAGLSGLQNKVSLRCGQSDSGGTEM